MNLKNALLIIFLTQTLQCVLCILSKEYIDLLDLPDNDEFYWSRHANGGDELQSAAASPNRTDFVTQQHHSMRKRQATNNNNNVQSIQDSQGFGACRTPDGEEGTCRNVLYCRMPELKDNVWRLVAHMCVIKGSTIGICCPARILSRLGPQIITDVNEGQPRSIERPEERGCGVTTKQFPRVSGGRPAESDEWPWMAAILRPGLPHVWCGGVLVTDRHVLTAAHCVHKIKKEEMFVRLGEYNTLLLNETRARDFRIASVVIHTDYNPLSYSNDIALVRVNRATIFNTYIWPVCMPPIGENWEGKLGIVTGWGTQAFGGPHSDILMEVSLPVWKLKDCREALVEGISEGMLCAGHPEGGQDSCQGDSGGPLLYQLPNMRWVTIGIVSWGVRCGEPQRPGIYTRVDKYLHWIIENSDV